MANGVLIVDDVALVRDYLARLCREQDWAPYPVDSGEAALALVERLPPSTIAVAVVDILMPGATMEGIEAARVLTFQHRIPCLMLTTVQEAATRVAAALAGAVGYVVKDRVQGDAAIVATIRAVLHGQPVPDPLDGVDNVEQALLAHHRRQALQHALARLTPQQQRVAHLMQQGYTNQEIARMLVVSPATVNTHVQEILARLGLRSRRDLAVRVLYDSHAD